VTRPPKREPPRDTSTTQNRRATDTDLAARRATAAGGTVQGDPWDSPYGRIATVQDPLGATFRVIRSAENLPE
jgi:predicted enzyme related to lactoylglutathione lyase